MLPKRILVGDQAGLPSGRSREAGMRRRVWSGQDPNLRVKVLKCAVGERRAVKGEGQVEMH
jgi:hypothetical protein